MIESTELKIDFPKHWVNDTFYPLLFDQSRYLLLRGGSGSSKSYFSVDKIIYRMLKERGNRFLFVRAIKDTIRNSMYRLFKDRVYQLGLEQFFEFRDTLLEVIVPLTGGEILCVGMNDRERLKSIADPTSAWVEEITELDEHDFLQLNMRLRSEKGGYRQTICSFNPIDEYHWLRNYFPDQIEEDLDKKYEARQQRRKYNKGWIDFKIDEISSRMLRKIKVGDEIAEIDYCLHLSSYEDNRFINLEYKAELEDLRHKDFNYWNIYAKAKWGSIGGLVFNPMWKFAEFPGSYDELIYGMDFGFVHPSVLVMIAIKDDNYYVKELLCESGLTNQKFIDRVKEEKFLEGDNKIYADHRPEYISEWVDAGFNVVPAEKGNDSVEKGVDLLKSINIFTNKGNTRLNRELKTYKYKLNDKGKPIEGQFVKLNDDCIDAVRYAVFSHLKRKIVRIGFID